MKDPIFKEAKEKNIGKANYISPEAQSLLMVAQEVGKKERSNYFTTPELAEKGKLFMPTGCPSGMIWEEWKDKDHVVYPALASAKLDGSKMYNTRRNDKVFLNTRSAKEHLNFKHIEEALSEFSKKRPNIVLDGEAYNSEYAERFEELQSIFRKQKPTEEQRALSEEIARFYVYDAIDLNEPDMDAEHRQFLLKEVLEEINHPYIIWWPSTLVDSEKEYDKFHEKCMDDGFEGSVLKIADASYAQRKNKFVMKRKPKFDCEFLITDVVEGEGTNKGIASKVIIDLNTGIGINKGHDLLLSKEGSQDAGMAKGWNHEMLANVLKNKSDYIGKVGTIEYGGITSHGKLRFPKFKALRDD